MLCETHLHIPSIQYKTRSNKYYNNNCVPAVIPKRLHR